MRSRGRPATLTRERRYPNRLRILRERLGLSQQIAAAAAEMSGAYYGALERGDKRINADTAQRLSKVLHCAAGDLLAGAGLSVPLVMVVAAAESQGRHNGYDLPEPYERLHAHRLADSENCVAAELLDDSANIDFEAGTVLFIRPLPLSQTGVLVGTSVLVRFFLGPTSDRGDRHTHEILYGILDRTIVGDLVLITRTQNRLIPRHMLIQSAADRRGPAERATVVAYEPHPDDPAELLGTVIYAMGPV